MTSWSKHRQSNLSPRQCHCEQSQECVHLSRLQNFNCHPYVLSMSLTLFCNCCPIWEVIPNLEQLNGCLQWVTQVHNPFLKDFYNFLAFGIKLKHYKITACIHNAFIKDYNRNITSFSTFSTYYLIALLFFVIRKVGGSLLTIFPQISLFSLTLHVCFF